MARGRHRAGGRKVKAALQIHDGTLTPRGQLDRSDSCWTDLYEDWWRIRPVGGSEIERAHKLWADTTHIVTARKHPSHKITARHRLRVLNSKRRIWIGRALDEDDYGRQWQLLCAEDGHADEDKGE